MVVPQILSKFHRRTCFPNMVMSSKYGHTPYMVMILKMGQFPNMVMVSKYGHTFKIGLYFKNRSLTKLACFPNMVMVSKYGHVLQIGIYLKIDQLPNMGMFSKYGHILQTVKLKRYNVFFILSYVSKARNSKYWHVVHIWSYFCD